MANNLTLNTSNFTTTGQKFGSGALSNGYASTAAVGVTAFPVTIEGWISQPSNPGAVQVAIGALNGSNTQWIGCDSNGNARASYNSPAVALASSVSLFDGNKHHVALVLTASGSSFYVDGTLTSSSNTAPTGLAPGLGIGNFYGQANFQWAGVVDEVAVWNTAKYTANFTPPTAAYAGTETGLVDLYHLDGNGTDSVSAAGVTIAPNNTGVSYSPYNWLVGSTSAKTINSGAYLKTAFTGASCSLTFDISGDAGSYLPQVWYRVDGLYWQVARIAASVSLAMPSETTAWPKHTLEVVVKATSEFQNRWSPQATAVVLTGIVLATGSAASAIVSAGGKNVLFLGDSITEGYHGINGNASGADDVAGSDVLAGWPWLVRDMLGAEAGIVGFGGQRLSTSGGNGQGGVPPLVSAYASLWSGQARTFSPAPDLVMINIGTNDNVVGVSTASFQADYTTLLNGLLSVAPNAKIAAIRPFNGCYAAQIQAAVAACSNPAAVTYVDTTGFFDTTLSVDQLHPLGVANVQTIAPSVVAKLKPLLSPVSIIPFRSMRH